MRGVDYYSAAGGYESMRRTATAALELQLCRRPQLRTRRCVEVFARAHAGLEVPVANRQLNLLLWPESDGESTLTLGL